MNTAVVTDSNSGIFKEEAEQLGVFVVPMPVIVESETYFENENITAAQFYTALAQQKQVSSSQPSPGQLTTLWKQLLERFDEIIYIPMSSGLSGSCASATLMAKEFDGKVAVADNHRISVTMRQSVLRARVLAGQGKSAAEIRESLEREGNESCVYLTVESLNYLKKTGRVTAATAAVADILNIKPVLVCKEEKFETHSKVHGLTKAKHAMIQAIEEERKTMFADLADEDIYIGAASSCAEPEDAEKWMRMVQEAFPACHTYYDQLSLSVACHTGPNAYGIGISRNPEK